MGPQIRLFWPITRMGRARGITKIIEKVFYFALVTKRIGKMIARLALQGHDTGKIPLKPSM